MGWWNALSLGISEKPIHLRDQWWNAMLEVHATRRCVYCEDAGVGATSSAVAVGSAGGRGATGK
jgi:hypothetical protein